MVVKSLISISLNSSSIRGEIIWWAFIDLQPLLGAVFAALRRGKRQLKSFLGDRKIKTVLLRKPSPQKRCLKIWKKESSLYPNIRERRRKIRRSVTAHFWKTPAANGTFKIKIVRIFFHVTYGPWLSNHKKWKRMISVEAAKCLKSCPLM